MRNKREKGMNRPEIRLQSDGVEDQSGNRFVEVRISSADLLSIQTAEKWLEKQYESSLLPESVDKLTIDRYDYYSPRYYSPGAEILMLQGIPGRSSNSTPSILNHTFLTETTPGTVTSSNWMDISPLSACDLGGLHVSGCFFRDGSAANSLSNSRVNTPGMEVPRTDSFNATTSDRLNTTDSDDRLPEKDRGL